MNLVSREAERVPKIELLILDVDGVLTSGTLAYDAEGQRQKIFHVHDGGAIRLWQQSGGRCAIISGRTSPAVEFRARELGIEMVTQGVKDKLPAYFEACRSQGVEDSAVSFMGDDLLDLEPMALCGYPIAVAGADPIVKRSARYVTRRFGGDGAVREAVERLMRLNGTWSRAIGEWTTRRPRGKAQT